MARENAVVKRVFKLFWSWQEREEEKWLEQMARSGWLLVKVFWAWYTFRRSEPREVVYRIDYKELAEHEAEEYRGLCEDMGWEYVGRLNHWFYFRRPFEPGAPFEFYTDNTSQLQRYRAQLRTMAAAFTPVFVVSLTLIPTALRPFDAWWAYALELGLIACALFLLYGIGRVWAIVRRLEAGPKE